MKIIYAGIMALMLLASLSFVVAENATNETVVLVSSEDNSSINVSQEIEIEFEEDVSSSDINREKMKNWFTFNQEKKAEREFKIAKMLLVKAKIEAKNNNTKAMEKALEAHNKILERIQERIKSIDESENSTTAVEKAVGLERAIEVHNLRIAKLNSLLQNENLTEEQRARIEAQIGRAENVTQKLSDVQSAQLEKFKIRLIAKANLTEAQAEAVIAELQNAEGVREMRLVLKEKRKEFRNGSKIESETEIEVEVENESGSDDSEDDSSGQNSSDDDSDDSNDDSEDDDSEDDEESSGRSVNQSS